MSDKLYSEFNKDLEKLYSSIGVSLKALRKEITQKLIGGNSIHPYLLDELPLPILRNIDDANASKFVLNYIKIVDKYKDLDLKFMQKLTENSAVGIFNSDEIIESVKALIKLSINVLDTPKSQNLLLVLENNQPSTKELITEFLKLSDDEIKVVIDIGEISEDINIPKAEKANLILQYITNSPVANSFDKGFINLLEEDGSINQFQELTSRWLSTPEGIPSNLIDYAVIDSINVPIEQTRYFVSESVTNRQILQLHAALKDPKAGGFIKDMLDNGRWDADGINMTQDLPYSSFSDYVDFYADNAFYGIENATNRYVELLRENTSKYINGDWTGFYVPDELAIEFERLHASFNIAFENLLDVIINDYTDIDQPDNIGKYFQNELGAKLYSMVRNELGSDYDKANSMHMYFQNPTEDVIQMGVFERTLTDEAVKLTGVVSPEFVDEMLEMRKAQPDLIPELVKTLDEIMELAKPDNIDNAYRIFELKPPPGDIFHLRPLKHLMRHVIDNKDVDVKFYNFNTGQFEELGITGVAKTGLQEQLPKKIYIEVTSKTDNVQDVRNFVNNIPEEAATKPTLNKIIAETPQDIVEYVDKSKLPEVEKVLKNPKIGPAISSTAMDFAKKAGKFGFGGVMAGFAPGDIAIETAIRKLLPRLGLVAISGPALAAYTAYELGLLAADAGAAFAKKQQGEKFWDNFGEISDKYSIGYKLTKEIHNTLFDEVYGKMNQNVYAGADS